MKKNKNYVRITKEIEKWEEIFMINSLFMLGSSYNKNRKISIAFMIGWLTYMILVNNFALGVEFVIINALVFLGVSIGINLVKDKFANTVLSVISILIWSIIIDIICYYLYPLKGATQTLFGYVFQGILFNYKYVFLNALVICLVNLSSEIIKKTRKIVVVDARSDTQKTKTI